jgi:molybdopterin synthase catalytic subunit
MAMTRSSSSRPAVADSGPAAVDSGPAVADGRQVEDGRLAEDSGGVAGPGGADAAADGMLPPVEIALSAEPLDMAGMLARAHHPAAGAVVLFSGEVRDNNRGKAVAYLEYEAHGPLAEKVIAGILLAAREKYSLQIAMARHRTGKAGIGETAVVVITASAHRKEAYAANQYIIDRIKQEAPIWKREYFTDGVSEWGAANGVGDLGSPR